MLHSQLPCKQSRACFIIGGDFNLKFWKNLEHLKIGEAHNKGYENENSKQLEEELVGNNLIATNICFMKPSSKKRNWKWTTGK